MRYLVTGASGHLGACLVRRLLGRGEHVMAVVRPQSNLWRLEGVTGQLDLIYADLDGYEAAGEHIKLAAPEVAIHLAWSGVTGGQRDDPAQMTRNVVGSLKLCEILVASGCRTWLGVGSQAEYGPYEIALREDLPPRPATAYGVSKLCTGLLTQKLCEQAGVRFVWVRLLATYGPKDDERHLIPMVIRQLLAGERPKLTAGEQKWDYLYVEDAAETIVRLAESSEARGFYNLGSGEAPTVRSIVERIRDLINPSLPLGLGELPYRPGQVMHLQADASRLREATGAAPAVPLDQGLRSTIEWYRATDARRMAAQAAG